MLVSESAKACFGNQTIVGSLVRNNERHSRTKTKQLSL